MASFSGLGCFYFPLYYIPEGREVANVCSSHITDNVFYLSPFRCLTSIHVLLAQEVVMEEEEEILVLLELVLLEEEGE